MNYGQIHLFYTLPVLSLLIFATYPIFQIDPHRTLYPLILLCIISFVYTTPWDNYLILKGGWSYPEGSVLGLIGYCPIEEYAFFIIQTCLTGSLWTLIRWFTISVPLANITRHPNGKLMTLSALAMATVIGWKIAIPYTTTFYLGMILFWACPVLILQLLVAYDYIANSIRSVGFTVLIPTLYLWYVDTIAIESGAWAISKESIVGYSLNKHLPIEEALFFLITNCMVVFGLIAIERTYSILEAKNVDTINTRTLFENTICDEFQIPQKELLDLLECYNITRNASSSFFLSTLFLPVGTRYKFWKLYAFARVTDDMIDHAKSDQERIEQLTIIQDFLDTKVVHDEQPSFRALLTLRVPMELIQSLIDGFKLDSNPTSFETDKQLLQYCHHVASSIGALSVHLFSCPHLQKEAETLGLALQLINIARDVKEDFLDNGRVYLIGITKNDVLSWISNEQKSRVDESIDWCLNTSEKLMEDNHVIDAMNQLSVKFQRATLAAYVMYNDINIRIRSGMESDKSDYKNRVIVPDWKKLLLFCGIWWKPQLWLADKGNLKQD